MVAGPVVPLDGSMLYADGLYVLYKGQWFWADTGRPWPERVVVGVRAGEPIPSGFTETPSNFKFIATREVETAELSALCAVETFCTWKNRVWAIAKIDASTRVATLTIAQYLRGGYPEFEPRPRLPEFRRMPGINYRDDDWISAQVRPAEMARVMLLVTPFEVPPPAKPILDGEVQVWVDSVDSSPWLPGEDALALVRERVAGEDAGSYPVERLQADRLRDGWRVWAVPPVSDDPLDVRVGRVVWYVADDGVVWRSSNSTEFRKAELELTNQLHKRLHGTRQMADVGGLTPNEGAR
ncbi:hypothetical protein AAFP35_17475 [Gordonia sp. CPCC 206044]|uniref:hypothetical protein n=1 Tax=Gordonia sp. CPCC 206044 TaxID=3140793 RepID=UPI003AF33FF2